MALEWKVSGRFLERECWVIGEGERTYDSLEASQAMMTAFWLALICSLMTIETGRAMSAMSVMMLKMP